jgi:hypothetical protein
MFFCIGTFAAIWSTHFSRGSFTNMGPGGFPLILGTLLAVLGLATIVVGLSTGDTPIATIGGKALILIPLSIAVFAATLERLGLIPAIALSVAIAGLANPIVRFREIAVLCVALVVFGAAVFVYGLALPLALFAQR